MNFAIQLVCTVLGFALLVYIIIMLRKNKKEECVKNKPNSSQNAAATLNKMSDGHKFERFTGTGVCDVCNASLTGKKAWIVPNHVFYNSPKYREYYRSMPMTLLMGITVTDADFARMEARDTSVGSAVCEDCIHMFE